jgi:hypothetical protein
MKKQAAVTPIVTPGCRPLSSPHHLRFYFWVSSQKRMSLARQTVIRRLSLMPAGNLPDATPAHHVDADTGNTPSIFRLLQPIICQMRT